LLLGREPASQGFVDAVRQFLSRPPGRQALSPSS
jgi:hypothetical protein